mmetsp:Transcript_15630/g.19061  ORF Transcript_15630/g.19061 Transcript_15630/m.19061 type:complete len:427 (+) Transcript_15630:109-1389(+)
MSFGAWGFGGPGLGMPSRFEEQYHCYSVAYADKSHLEGGDKILLPPSALESLARLRVDYPMLFRLQSSDKGTMTHSGVLEFSAEEGSCFVPFWMMQNLLIEEGSVITVTNVSLPKATFVKLQPQSVDFLEISNPRAVLEHALRLFSCVTKGDVIQLPFNNKNYHFELKDVQPQDAACIIETDCNVDFDAPVGYKEPNMNQQQSQNDNESMHSSLGDGAGGNGSDEGHDSLRNTLKSIPKQSAFADKNMSEEFKSKKEEENKPPPSIKIVDGKVIRPEDSSSFSGLQEDSIKMLAEKAGATGVQKNSAIAVTAPQIDYWAVNAGDGARLDGKKSASLKDADGNEINVRKLRAEAAAKRLAMIEANKQSMPSAGTMVNGKEASIENTGGGGQSNAPVASKRKSRVGSKFSKLKQSGGFSFQGSANSME